MCAHIHVCMYVCLCVFIYLKIISREKKTSLGHMLSYLASKKVQPTTLTDKGPWLRNIVFSSGPVMLDPAVDPCCDSQEER